MAVRVAVGPWMQFDQLKRREFITMLGGAALGLADEATANPEGRHKVVALVRNDRQQLLEPFASLRSYNPEFSHMRPQRIDHLGLLPQQKIEAAS